MDCDAPPSPSPVPVCLLPDIVDSGMLTSPAPTCSVSCNTDNFGDLDFAAPLEKNDNVESLEKALEVTRAELGSQKATFASWKRAFGKQKSLYEQTLKSLSEHTRQKRIDHLNLRNLKDTVSDLRKQIELLQADQHTIFMLHQLLSTFTTADVVYKDNITPTNFQYKFLASELSTACPTRKIGALLPPGSPPRC